MKTDMHNEKKTYKPEKKKIAFWRSIFVYLKEYRIFAFFAIFFSALTGVFVAIQPFVIKYIVDEGITVRKSLPYVAVACGIFLFVVIARIVLYRIALHNTIKVLEGTLFKMRSHVFNHISHLCMRFYDKRSTGEIYNCIMGSPMSQISNFLRSVFISIPYQMISFFISLGAMVYYDWVLTSIMLLTAVAMAILSFFSRKKIRKSSKIYMTSESEAGKYISDIFHGMDSVKMYSIEENVENQFLTHLKDMRTKGVAYTFSVSREGLKPELANYIGTAIVYFVGAFSCLYRGLTVGTLYAFLSSMGVILGTLNSWLGISLTKSAADSGLERVLEMINETTSTPDPSKNDTKDINASKKKAEAENLPCIEFNHVEFAYTDKNIFNGLCCKINYNESIALVGGSGSGKSTFGKLLMRLYDINSGEIKVHGENVKNYKGKELRYSFGIVPQNPFVFLGTVIDNVRITCPYATDEEIKRAMKIARVDEFVTHLPDGINTMIGDGALTLSGGQKQRIAIARAVLKNPDILLFDEATSALDNISEKHIQASIDDLMKEHTVIIIAHRLSTIRNVDRILVFDDGKIVEDGDYNTLAHANGIFQSLLDCTGPDEALPDAE